MAAMAASATASIDSEPTKRSTQYVRDFRDREQLRGIVRLEVKLRRKAYEQLRALAQLKRYRVGVFARDILERQAKRKYAESIRGEAP